MIKTVLLPLDGSELAESALPHAVSPRLSVFRPNWCC